MAALPATTSPLLRRYSLEEFFALDPPPGGGHYELIAGVLYMVPPPTFRHDLAVSNLNRYLSRYADAHPDRCRVFVPRAAVWTPRDTYLEPDVFLATPERVRAHPDGLDAADLVVEVLSPGSAVYDRTAKADTYGALGVRELWLVDLERQAIEQRVLADGRWDVRGVFQGDDVLESGVFQGLRVTPALIFAD